MEIKLETYTVEVTEEVTNTDIRKRKVQAESEEDALERVSNEIKNPQALNPDVIYFSSGTNGWCTTTNHDKQTKKITLKIVKNEE